MEHSTRTLIITIVISSMLVGFGSSDLAQDRAECTDQLISLSTCLPYVGGNAKAPTKDCCGGFDQVIVKSQKCICILIKDKDDPELGIKFNATLAVRIPTVCHLSSPSITECISILHVSPNSTLAKEFESLGKIQANANNSTSANTKNVTAGGKAESEKKSNGGEKKSWLGVELLIFVLLIISSPTPSFI